MGGEATVTGRERAYAAAVIARTFSGARNCDGEIVPAFICTNAFIAAWSQWIAAKSCCCSGGGGASVAISHVNSYIDFTRASRVCW